MIALELFIVDEYYLLTTLPSITLLIALGIQCISVFAFRSFLFWIQCKGIGKKQVMIIAGDAHSARAIVDRIISSGKTWFEVKGIILASNWKEEILESNTVDIDLVILSHDLTPSIKNEAIRFVGSKRIEVLVVPELYELFLKDAELQFIDDLLVYSIIPPNLSYLERMIKRTMDICFSFILLVITSPIMLSMLYLIPKTSNGKAIFRQERIGLDGKPFMVLKFRAMIDNAEQTTGPTLAADHDARVTKLGSFIRSTRIDELPQLLNVLKGEMSLVGPRPEREFFINEFMKHDSQKKQTTNSRKGKSKRNIISEYGEQEIAVPRDREGEFEPLVVKKHQSNVTGIEDQIIALYAKGVSTREIQDHLRNLYGIEVSPTFPNRNTKVYRSSDPKLNPFRLL